MSNRGRHTTLILNSFILSATRHSELADNSITIEEWNNNHVLFMEDSKYLEKMFTGMTK